jgi:hypothetical protein
MTVAVVEIIAKKEQHIWSRITWKKSVLKILPSVL